MSLFYVSDNYDNNNNVLYIRENLSELFFKKGKMKIFADKHRAGLQMIVDDEYESVAKEELFDKICDVITVGYKYNFFAQKIKLDGMKSEHKQLLLSSIIAADFEDDKRYVKHRLSFVDKSIAIDGVYEFRLKNLKNKWLEIVNYIPDYFSESELKSFIIYLTSEKKGKKVLIDGEKVYDRRFNRLKRVQLLPDGELKIVKEVLISGADEIELKGKLPHEDEIYLKEYFGDKICFTPY